MFDGKIFLVCLRLVVFTNFLVCFLNELLELLEFEKDKLDEVLNDEVELELLDGIDIVIKPSELFETLEICRNTLLLYP